jgi:hypothetical protein
LHVKVIGAGCGRTEAMSKAAPERLEHIQDVERNVPPVRLTA